MKKILYLMAIDWYWIKQRPQFIAEMLNDDFDVTVIYLKEVFVSQSLRSANDEIDKSYAVAAIPFRDKFVGAFWVQNHLIRRKIDDFNEFDYIWITHPLLYRYVPKNYKGKIIYDCMDNHIALCADKMISKKIEKVERELIQKADVIFTTSIGLLNKVNKLGGNEKSYLVRNGFQCKNICKPSARRDEQVLTLGYFGTIANWIDFSLLISSLDEIPELIIYLWGPIADVIVPSHPRLIVKGVVEHEQLWEETKEVDCLIMPFQVNDIIKDVDPVKLYEYISMGKNIISVYYDEIERFRPFVSFYHSKQEFIDVAKTMLLDKKVSYTAEQQNVFLSENSWTTRYQYIMSKII